MSDFYKMMADFATHKALEMYKNGSSFYDIRFFLSQCECTSTEISDAIEYVVSNIEQRERGE